MHTRITSIGNRIPLAASISFKPVQSKRSAWTSELLNANATEPDLSQLANAAVFLMAVGILLAGWGVFIRLNRSAEELEPEAMAQAKREDKKLE